MHCDLTPEIHHVSLGRGLLCLKASDWKPWTVNETVACKGTSSLSGLRHLSEMDKCLIDVHSKEGMRYYIAGACYRLLLDEDSTLAHAYMRGVPFPQIDAVCYLRYRSIGRSSLNSKSPVSYSSVVTLACLPAILTDGITTQGKPGVDGLSFQ